MDQPRVGGGGMWRRGERGCEAGLSLSGDDVFVPRFGDEVRCFVADGFDLARIRNTTVVAPVRYPKYIVPTPKGGRLIVDLRSECVSTARIICSAQNRMRRRRLHILEFIGVTATRRQSEANQQSEDSTDFHKIPDLIDSF